MTHANVAQTCPEDWAYLSEGGSTIVFSYTGPSHPDFTGKVLRLRKTFINTASRDTTVEEDDPVIAFQNTVIAALVPSRFLPDLEVVHLDASWLAALETLRHDDRPAERRAKDQLDTARRKGILATDLIRGADTLAVEIKPKWGFLPNPAHLSEGTTKVKMSTCRFCMHTRFRSKDGDVPTQYCPLDLYSKDRTRVRKAIHDLWNGWVQSDGKLNNLRVFLAGKMTRPSESDSSIGEFLAAGTKVDEAFATALLPLLLQTPVLEVISDLQRSLDALDIEGIVKLQGIASLNGKEFGPRKGNPSLEQLQGFVASYSVYRALDHSEPSPENIDTYLMAYLLSATFKDCSVILRIHRSDVSGNPSVDAPHAISIIDLDLKAADRIEQWAILDRRIVEYYRDTAERKSCVE